MAQLVAHLHGMQGVRGSSPLRSTNPLNFDNLFSTAQASDYSNLASAYSVVICQEAYQSRIGLALFWIGAQPNSEPGGILFN